ncbi:hypothetical protein, partial [Mesorhizobium sp. M7A.F.Ca.CA.003.01.2.1]|uniref:hypothetical protein n=1 Tax=Mesorhizobium sp. M7A.F.Ca.CA.003.01.2.1 TaxID=2496722 RepID=UPI0013DECB0F
SKESHDGKGAGVVQLVGTETDIDPVLFKSGYRQQCKGKNSGKRGEKGDPFDGWIKSHSVPIFA